MNQRSCLKCTVLMLLLLVSPVTQAVDNRQMVELPTDMQKGILINMRDHLEALLDILKLLSKEDFGQAADIAENRIGLSSTAAKSANYMAPLTPEGMRSIGARMHTAASRFARKTKQGDLDQAYNALGVIIIACESCHNKYRIR